MQVQFSKYQGTGNDFVMLDNLSGDFNSLSVHEVQLICDRKKGVGADGLIKLSKSVECDFEVEYYNSDGSQSFCGNGARCAVAFAKSLGVIKNEAVFNAIDGVHHATISNGLIRLQMLDVKNIEQVGEAFVLDTGSPHYVHFNNESTDFDIVQFGKSIRYSERFREEGINVNIVREIEKNTLSIETYERGVEDETLSCGTGVTACALVYKYKKNNADKTIKIVTKGGNLFVECPPVINEQDIRDIWLIGPAVHVFDGVIDV